MAILEPHSVAIKTAADPRPSARGHSRSVATRLPGPICARPECGRPFTPHRGGSRQRFCKTRCRWLAWAATHPRRSTERQ